MTDREWILPVPSPLHENPPDKETKHQKISGKRRSNQEYEAGAYRRGGKRDGRTPLPGADRDLRAGRGRQRQERTSGTQWQTQARGAGCRYKRWRPAGRRVRETSRWTALRSGRVGGQQVQERGVTTEKNTDGGRGRGGGRIEGVNVKIQKIGGDRWGGRVRITCVISNVAQVRRGHYPRL